MARTGLLPAAQLLEAKDGNFYGTTAQGGVPPSESYGSGTVFKMTPDGKITKLVTFTGPNGVYPLAPLMQATDGDFYGTTAFGGKYSKGTIFRMAPDGQLTTLVSLDGTNGAGSGGALVQWYDGNFYGTTGGGGANDDGTVFKMTPSGELSVLFSFEYWSSSGATPNGLTLGRDGNLYGTTQDGGANYHGTIFRIVMPGPPLNLACEANQIVLSWPTNRAGFSLQSSTDMNSASWTDCTNSPAMGGSRFFVTNNLADGNRFYRLRRTQ